MARQVGNKVQGSALPRLPSAEGQRGSTGVAVLCCAVLADLAPCRGCATNSPGSDEFASATTSLDPDGWDGMRLACRSGNMRYPKAWATWLAVLGGLGADLGQWTSRPSSSSSPPKQQVDGQRSSANASMQGYMSAMCAGMGGPGNTVTSGRRKRLLQE